MRDILVELASIGLFRAKWTDLIHDEWMRSVLADRKDLTEAQLTRTKELMNRAAPDSLVEGYEALIDSLHLPDENDRHVLAAGIVASCDAIITFNLKDFPKSELDKYQIERMHPDDFLFHQFGLNDSALLIAAQKCRSRLKNPPKSANEYLDTLEKQGLPKTVSELRNYARLI